MAAKSFFSFPGNQSSSGSSCDEDYSPTRNPENVKQVPIKVRGFGLPHKARKRKKFPASECKLEQQPKKLKHCRQKQQPHAIKSASSRTVVNSDIIIQRSNDKKEPSDSIIKASADNIASHCFFEYLPADVILCILFQVVRLEGALPFLVTASKVCRVWREVSTSPKLWHSVVFKHDPLPSVDSAIKWLARAHGGHVKSLHISHCSTFSRKGMACIQTQLAESLHECTIDSCSNVKGVEVVALGNHLKNARIFRSLGPCLAVRTTLHVGPLMDNPLEELELNVNCDFLYLCHTAIASKAVFKRLKLLSLTAELLFANSALASLQIACPNLRHLALQLPTPTRNFPYLAPGKSPDQRSPGFKNLTSLCIQYAKEAGCSRPGELAWERHFLSDLLSGNPPLDELCLMEFRSVPIDFLCALAPPTLSSLSLSRIDFKEIIEYVLEHFVALKFLHLHIPLKGQFCCVDDEVLEHIAASAHSSTLEKLHIPKSHVTDSGVQHLVEACPSLKVLDLQGCRSLSRGLKQIFTQDNIHVLHSKLQK